ncbi:PAS domain-containing sensor histidine kinase [Nostoc sp. 'Lobaria pulmonaria (5183) cyanobiont']|uniref:PAS domain-containing sensor histidine kinase n=1 Tax=Nostoc sp. 'Lobaria pulmonaria (5183) cyanobiont' TaxID=1618022 RepID=UPI000CF3038B|nr:PAS domain S-box protein [Nostoc sp. 'Lobaria pulmonaria (5183) cyanobiont']AVH73695.1 histidine kinase [Nostoc sp. 'Lobaria pulmonaria (5183) cyanobiont']
MNHSRFLDKSAPKQNTQQQNFSLAFLYQTINGISDPIFVKDRQHRWVLLNDTYCDFVGHSREELIDKSDYDFFPQAEADVLREKDELVFTANIPNENQNIFTDAQGITHLISTKKSCFEDETGNKFLVGSIRDIILQNEVGKIPSVTGRVTDTTNLMETCEALRETLEELQVVEEELRLQNEELAIARETAEFEHRRYQDLFDLAPDAYLVTDVDGIIKEANYVAAALLSVKQKFLLGKPFILFITESDHQTFMNQLANLQQVQDWEVYLQPRRGTAFPARIRMVAMYNSQGQQVGWRWLLGDISEQQAALRDRQQAEKNLHRMNAVLQAQHEASIDAILIIDENLTVTSFNQKFSQLWQIPAAILETRDDRQLLGWVLDKLVNPDEFLAKVEYLYQHPEESSHDEIFLKSGKIFERYSAPVRKQQGACSDTSPLENYYGRVWYYRDITEYKQAEAQLRASQQRLALLIEQTPLAIIEWNTNFQVQTWNRAAERIFGYTTEEMLGNHFEIVVPENARKHVNEILIALLTQQGGSFSVNENVTKDGRTIVGEWYNNPLVAADGQLLGVASMVLDITERKRAEEEQQKFVALIENSSDFIGIASMEGQIVYVNPAGLKMVGLSSLEVAKTKSLVDFYSPEAFAEFIEQITPLIFQHGSWQGEFHYRHFQTGIEIPTDCSLFMVKHPATGEPFCRVAIVRDITERKQAKEALLKSEAQLRQQAQELKVALRELQHTQTHLIQTEKMSSLGQLVAGVAHEINNPVNFIYGNLSPAKEYTQDLLSLLQLYQSHYPEPVLEIQDFADQIELDFLKSDFPQIINSMKVGADRIREIVLSLRTFSRLDEAEMKAVDIHQGIDSTLMILQNRLKGNDQRPTIEIIKEYGKLQLVECYAGQLNQVFMNILSNAIDALEESFMICPIPWENARNIEQRTSPQICICTQLQEPNQVIIRITDNGLGIPEDVKKQLFDPFFTTKPIGQGTGMGLAISYQIITERHGGSLECFSQLEQGAEFVIKIPLSQDTST